MGRVYLKLGEILAKEGLITKEQLDEAMSVQKKEGGRIGEILIRLGRVSEQDIIIALSKQLSIPYASLKTGFLKPVPNQGLEDLIAKDFALKNCVLPLSRNLNSLTCALNDPFDLVLIDNIRKITGCEINPIIATRSDIIQAIEDFYGKRDLLKQVVEESYDMSSASELPIEESISDEESLSLDRLIARAEEAPVVKLVDLIIRQAIDERSSDIHIEPYKDKISLRYRIDGKLYEVPPPARHLHLPIISRVKILSKMDIAEKRLPQDGGFMVKLEDRTVDLRVSTIPTIYGEKVVLRILDKSMVVLDLDQLGFEPRQLEDLRKAINSPYGLVFLTGPTGCGKTTTLYAILSEIKSPTKNIVTVEDPVEYRLEGINQVHIKPEIGLTFATALRSFLRQDPDVMLVGEVRDLETAEICVRSALVGKLVLSTLHTNDAPSACMRIIDMGIEPFLLGPSLLLVVGQRLARKLCVHCKEAYEYNPETFGGLKLNAELVYRAKGCPECNHTGYKGRVCLAETMVVDENLKELISKRAEYSRVKEYARKNGMETLQESGFKKVEKGITSLEEVLSVTL